MPYGRSVFSAGPKNCAASRWLSHKDRANGDVVPFFADDCVPSQVGQTLRQAGHQAHFLRDVMAHDAPDGHGLGEGAESRRHLGVAEW